MILCVDDERLVLDSLKEQLGRRFDGVCEVEVAESGEEALEVIEELLEDGSHVPVLVSDHIMPGMRGDELLARVHKRWPRIRNVLLTGQAGADAVGRAVNRAGLFRYVSKPWEDEDLGLTLAQAIEAYFRDIELEEQRATLANLHSLAVDLSANLAAGDRYRRLIEGARSALDASQVLLVAAEDGALITLASHGIDGVDDGARVDAASHPPLGEALASRASVRVGRTTALPLLVGGELAGAMWLQTTSGNKTGAKSNRIEAFSAVAAAAIRTSRLVDAMEDDVERRRQLARALQAEANADIHCVTLGNSVAAQKLRANIDAAAAHDGPVLITGASGVGKEAVARSIHDASERREFAFITVRCGLLRSSGRSLHDPGPDGAPSKVQLARDGTLYLDGVESLPSQDRNWVAERHHGLRIIASRTEPQSSSVFPPGQGTEIVVPTLAARINDIPPIVEHFITRYATRHRRTVDGPTRETLQCLCRYPWPGNLEELENVVLRALATAKGAKLEIDDAALGGGASFGQYQLIERLGRGGMGEVWRARHAVLARPAALKVIRPGTVDATIGEELAIRFRREAEATASLRSPHTVELYDFGVNDAGAFYYVMEQLDGVDLDTLVKRYGPPDVERTVWFLEQACRSLIEAHGAGLVHRDIKPANLFTCRLGAEHDVLKVLDFGMVRVPQADLHITAEGHVTGTPAYMPPEQATGDTSVDARADIYSLGCVAFFLLTGRSVFDGANPLMMIMNHLKSAPVAPSSLSEHDIPSALDDVVLACLAKKPEGRPQSAEELWAQLRGLELRRRWNSERGAEWWQRHKLD